jgi:hypothetical protein
MGGAPDSQVASRLQRTSRCEVAHLGVDPVPGGCGNHRGVRAGLTVPILEASLDDLHRVAGQVSSCPCGQRRPGLERGDPQAAPGQRQRSLPWARTDLDDPITGLQAGDRDEPVEQPLRVLRAGLLVRLGSGVKCPRQSRALVSHEPSLPRAPDGHLRCRQANGHARTNRGPPLHRIWPTLTRTVPQAENPGIGHRSPSNCR